MFNDINQFELLNHICSVCNLNQCCCSENNLETGKVNQDCECASNTEMHSTVCESVTLQNILENEQVLQANSNDLLRPCTVHTASTDLTHNEHCHYVNLHFK